MSATACEKTIVVASFILFLVYIRSATPRERVYSKKYIDDIVVSTNRLNTDYIVLYYLVEGWDDELKKKTRQKRVEKKRVYGEHESRGALGRWNING